MRRVFSNRPPKEIKTASFRVNICASCHKKNRLHFVPAEMSIDLPINTKNLTTFLPLSLSGEFWWLPRHLTCKSVCGLVFYLVSRPFKTITATWTQNLNSAAKIDIFRELRWPVDYTALLYANSCLLFFCWSWLMLYIFQPKPHDILLNNLRG